MRSIHAVAVLLLLILSTGQHNLTPTEADHLYSIAAAINAYALPAGANTPNFTMTVYPLSQTIHLGETATYQIQLNSTNGFTGEVSLQTKNFPQELIKAFNPSKLNLSANTKINSTLTVNSLPAGEPYYEFVITATSGNITQAIDVSLTILAENPPITLASYAFLAGITIFAAFVIWYGLRTRTRDQADETVDNRPKPPPV